MTDAACAPGSRSHRPLANRLHPKISFPPGRTQIACVSAPYFHPSAHKPFAKATKKVRLY